MTIRFRQTISPVYICIIFFLVSLFIFFGEVNAQTTLALLGVAPGGGPSGNGTTTTAQTVTFYTNATTPSSPTVRATYTLSNQQFNTTEGNPSVQGTTFGTNNKVSTNGSATDNLAQPTTIYPLMNAISGNTAASINPFYTLCNSCTAGTGIDIAANKSIWLFNASDALINASSVSAYALTARVRYADLTITFSQAVDNPVLQLTGLGGFYSYYTTIGGFTTYYTQGFSTEFDLISAGLTWRKLSGNAALNVSTTQITNGATKFGASTLGAALNGIMRTGASGSVAINGTNIRTLTLRIYLKGDGGTITDALGNAVAANNSNNPLWSCGLNYYPNNTPDYSNAFSGDAFLIGLSLTCSPPVLLTQPVGFTACIGGVQTLSVVASNTTGYQWQSSPNGATWTNINGATAASYTPTSNVAGMTYYRVVMDGGNCGSVNSNASLVTIVTPPSVNLATLPNTVCSGSSTTLSATQSGGSGGCTFQWQSSPNGSTWTNISGATNSNYTISNLSTTTRYRVQLVNCTGSGCCN